jgi:hypothetical protein
MKPEEKQVTEFEMSKRQERKLLKALESVVSTQFPNPERKGCPGIDVLRLIATKELPMRDPAFEHVGRCSPCFRDVRELRADIQRKRMQKAGTGAMVVLVAALIGYFTFRPSDVTTRTDTPLAPVYESVSVDLRDFQTTRSDSPAPGNQPAVIPRVPRRALALTISLPIGFLEGQYEVQISDTSQNPLATGMGNAVIEDYITKLRVNLDLSSLAEGEYRLGIRPVGFSLRQYPVVIQ